MKESRINIYFQSYSSPNLDSLAWLLRTIITDEGMAVILPILIWIFTPIQGILLIQLICISEIVNAVIKWIVQRPRPFWIDPMVKNVGGLFEGDYSFPSSHSQLVAAICYFMQPENQVAKTLLWIWAFLTGMSRIYAGVHYLSDVIVGWTLGILLAFSFKTMDLEQILQKYSDDHEMYSVCITLVVSIYSLLWSVKTLVPDPLKSQLKQWQETARNASINKKKTIQPRLLSKYSFIIWAQLGILLGYYYSHHDSAIAFPNESCLDPPVLMNAIYRYFFGVVGIACIVPIAIISIPGVKAKDVQIGLVSILLGLWVAYGNAKVSNHLGLSCSNK